MSSIARQLGVKTAGFGWTVAKHLGGAAGSFAGATAARELAGPRNFPAVLAGLVGGGTTGKLIVDLLESKFSDDFAETEKKRKRTKLPARALQTIRESIL